MSIRSDHQLENARLLATKDAGRPRETSLRRAVSTAYYALFQALCYACANELVGWKTNFKFYTPIFRAVDHSAATRAFDAKNWLDAPEVRSLGIAFADLKAAREWADYNPEPRPNYDETSNNKSFTREEAMRLIETAQTAIEILERLVKSDKERLRRLALRLVVNHDKHKR